MVGYDEYVTILGVDHLLYILGLIVCGLGLYYFKDKIRDNRERTTIFILMISLLQQLLLYGSYYFIVGFTLAESLPLHISRISSILGIIYLVTKNEKIIKIIAYFGMYAWISFLYPTNIQGILHPLGVSFFVNHVITLLLPFYAIIVYDVRIEINDKNKVFPVFLVFLTTVYFMNDLVNGNYFYLSEKPVFASVPDIIYIPSLAILSYLLFVIGEAGYLQVQKTFSRSDSTIIYQKNLKQIKINSEKIQ